MPTSASNLTTPARPVSPSGNPGARHRHGKRILFFLGFLLVIAVVWFEQVRKISWQQALNPAYWVAHYRGEDLYDEENAILMRGNPALMEVALTFDDGPQIGSRASILATLREEGIRATFFDVGMRMEQNPDLVRQTLAEGHEIANHTYYHRRLNTLTPHEQHREINDTDIAYYRITGQHLRFMRPPGVRYNAQVLATTKELGYILVGYTNASHDFRLDEDPEAIAARTIKRTDTGSIILLHDYPGTALALPHIIRSLRKQGYRFVTISQIIDHLPDRNRLHAERFLEKHAPARERAAPRPPAANATGSRPATQP